MNARGGDALARGDGGGMSSHFSGGGGGGMSHFSGGGGMECGAGGGEHSSGGGLDMGAAAIISKSRL